MSNGYPMAAIIGREAVMQAGQDSFISSTYWTERIGPTAALATINKHRQLQVHDHLNTIGTSIERGWQTLAAKHGLRVHTGGIKPLIHFQFLEEQPQALRTLFTQYMLERGYLTGPSVYATLAHTSEHVSNYLDTVDEVFDLITNHIRDNNIIASLKGPIVHEGFKRLI
jgi:glutamate-1-semialdehyde aminotransferase